MTTAFHLSFHARDLESSKRFYRDVLGCSIGRERGTWFDVDFFGHQVTIHQATEAHVLPGSLDHFGANLNEASWAELLEALSAREVVFRVPPSVRHEGHPWIARWGRHPHVVSGSDSLPQRN